MTELNGDANFWSEWLRGNIDKHFIDSDRRHAWQGVSHAHDPRSSLDVALGEFVQSLDVDQQVEFKKAVVNCANNLPFNNEYVDALILIGDLARETNCIEIIESGFMEKILFEEPLGLFSSNCQDEYFGQKLFSAANHFLRSFAGKGDNGRVAEIGHQLLEMQDLPDKYTYLTLLFMVKSDPDNAIDHWKDARSHNVALIEGNKIKGIDMNPRGYPALRKDFEGALSDKQLKQFVQDVCNLDDYTVADKWFLEVLATS